MEDAKAKKESLHKLHIELVKLQKEIISTNLKVLVILEGRDAAGKDGTIKRIVKHLHPRETRVVAMGKPSSRQEAEWYFQRYVDQLPVSGEMVIFNRSWYNRAGVEKVMGFCTDKEYKSFFPQVELFEKMLSDSGFIILKYYLDISKPEQEKRLDDRKKNPLKQWKISPVDEVALEKFEDYSEARDKMLSGTDFRRTPWFVVNADDKKTTRLALITHLLSRLDYKKKNKKSLSVDYGLINPVSRGILN
ncbi:MAG: polyphosphate kinase 2 [Bacteroidetes bacterium]|nr:polyphosphate kinase 2 [Bacteroidota bacterium]